MLHKRGWYVIPSYDFSGPNDDKAPKLQGLGNGFVLPDLDISRNGKRKWAEVKTKDEATFTRITQKLEHGIPLRHFRDYKIVREITGCEVFLFVYEIRTGDILYASLDNPDFLATKRIYKGNKMSLGGMIFWPREAFGVLCNILQPSFLNASLVNS